MFSLYYFKLDFYKIYAIINHNFSENYTDHKLQLTLTGVKSREGLASRCRYTISRVFVA